ncbi:hypothetical protein [Ideonella dechloratans]|uniref:hypothetical protein n=1 Tax=Ideonella dechloratans TaxID=36863 RepID=UPI0035B0DF68
MIFNERLLFLHVPKTGGMAMTQALLAGLPGQVWCTAPNGHHPHKVRDEQVLRGTRHETLPQARELLAHEGRRLEDFERIVAVMRNPYEQEASRYHYLRLGLPHDRGPAQALALAGDFEAFACQSRWWFDDLGDYYRLDGGAPPQLRCLRHEQLAEDYAREVGPFLQGAAVLPRVNESGADARAMPLSAAAEEAIWHKYRWVFDAGHYPRRAPDA